MKLHGIQKMTLLDFPGVVSCTIFLGGCDFRCPFCHNFELIDGTAEPIMDDGELIEFLRSRKALIDGVAITGASPACTKICRNSYAKSAPRATRLNLTQTATTLKCSRLFLTRALWTT